ncbi:hypothetical protein D3C80_1159710 [compost metagenome]
MPGRLGRRAADAGPQHDGGALLFGQLGQRLLNQGEGPLQLGPPRQCIAGLAERLELFAHLPREALEISQQLGEVGQSATAKVADHLLDLLLALKPGHLLQVIPHQLLELADPGVAIAQLAFGQ